VRDNANGIRQVLGSKIGRNTELPDCCVPSSPQSIQANVWIITLLKLGHDHVCPHLLKFITRCHPVVRSCQVLLAASQNELTNSMEQILSASQETPPHFMELKCSLPCTQQPATFHHLESFQFIPRSRKRFL
jgi:hypothetical protein